MNSNKRYHISSLNFKICDQYNLIIDTKDNAYVKINNIFEKVNINKILRIEANETLSPELINKFKYKNEIRFFLKSNDIGVISEIINQFSDKIISINLINNGNIIPAVNFITSKNIPVFFNISEFLLLNSNDFENLVNHYFHNPLLKVPIEFINSLVFYKNNKNEIDLADIVSDKFDIDYFVSEDGYLSCSKKDFIEKKFIGHINDGYDTWKKSIHYIKYIEKEKKLFLKISKCIKCPIFSYCHGYIENYELNTENKDLCNLFLQKYKIICNEIDKLFCDIKELHSDFENKSIKSANIYIADKCINNCIFCAVKEKRESIKPINKKNIIQSIKQSFIEGARAISFSGFGEPTLCEYIFEYIDIAKSTGFKEIIIFTNGAGINKDNIENYKMCGATGFLVSLHGLENSHDFVTRRSGSYREAIRAIELIVQNNINCTVNTCITRINKNELRDLLILTKEKNVINHSITFPEWTISSANYKDALVSYYETKEILNFLNYEYFDHIILDNIPMCVFNKKIKRVNKKQNILLYDNENNIYLFNSFSNNMFSKICFYSKCPFLNDCIGIDKIYYSLHGDEEFYDLRTGISL